MSKGSEVVLYAKNNVAPPSAVAACRPPVRNILFTPESDTAVAALTGADFYESFVGKLNHV